MRYDSIAPTHSSSSGLDPVTLELEQRNAALEHFESRREGQVESFRDDSERKNAETKEFEQGNVDSRNIDTTDLNTGFDRNYDPQNQGNVGTKVLGPTDLDATNVDTFLGRDEMPVPGPTPMPENALSILRQGARRRPNFLRARNSSRLSNKNNNDRSDNNLNQLMNGENVDISPPSIVPSVSDQKVGRNKLPLTPSINRSPLQEKSRSFILSKGRQRLLVQTQGPDGQEFENPESQNQVLNVGKRKTRRRKSRRKLVRKNLRESTNKQGFRGTALTNDQGLTDLQSTVPQVDSIDLGQIKTDSSEDSHLSYQEDPVHLRSAKPIFLEEKDLTRLQEEFSGRSPAFQNNPVNESPEPSGPLTQTIRPSSESHPKSFNESQNYIPSSPTSVENIPPSSNFPTSHFPSPDFDRSPKLSASLVGSSFQSTTPFPRNPQSTNINTYTYSNRPSFSRETLKPQIPNFNPYTNSNNPSSVPNLKSQMTNYNSNRPSTNPFSGQNENFRLANAFTQLKNPFTNGQNPDIQAVNAFSQTNNPNTNRQTPNFPTTPPAPQFEKISFPLSPPHVLPLPSRNPSRPSDVITSSDVYYPVYGTLYVTDKNSPSVTSRIHFIQTVPSGSYSMFNLGAR